MKKHFILCTLLLLSLQIVGKERNLLVNSIAKDELARVLAKQTEWVTLPAYADRQTWNSLPAEIRRDIIDKAEKSLSFEWGVVKATDYLEFTRSGNRDVMQNPENKRTAHLQNLVLGELVEGKGRFIDAMINGVWAICEQSTWVLSAHLPAQKGGAGLPNPDDVIIDLGSGRIGAFMSWIHYYFAGEFDKISPHISERIRREVKNRILTPYYTRDDLWWMGFKRSLVNNWNVWVNYNVLQCILLMETDQQKRVDNVYKVMHSVDKFINYYKDDGGCDEGPSYWGHAGGKFSECLELLYESTGGRVNIFNNELVQNMARYIYRVYINKPYFVNFADAAAKIDIDPGVVYRYGKAIGDKTMQGFASFYAQENNFDRKIPSGTLESVLYNLFDAVEIVSNEAIEPLIGECWLPDTELALARDKAGSREGFYFAAKGGFNDESHNHNDVGTFILYYNGLPALIDVGVGTYTRQTFSNERYSIWTMQSGYHNLPVINGHDQKFGKEFMAKNARFSSRSGKVNFSVDIAGAYPDSAGVKSWVRSYQLNRSKDFTITDTYALLANKGGNSLHFMTCCEVSKVKEGVLQLNGEGFVLEMRYDAANLSARVEDIKIEDKRLEKSWGATLYRICLDINNTNLSGKNSIRILKSK